MSIRSWFCKHNWKRVSCERLIKHRTLQEFWPNQDKLNSTLELHDFSCLEYEVVSETFVCEHCGEIKHFVS